MYNIQSEYSNFKESINFMPRWPSVISARKSHYLGHVVSKEGIKVDPHKIETITKWHRAKK